MWESIHVSKRPLRGPQAEVLMRVERLVGEHRGGVATIRLPRQTGKNELAATLHRRHLWRRQYSPQVESWVRTAPTYKPQIVNSKKRLRELLQLDSRKRIHHPLFGNARLTQEEGYIWKLGNATIEFISSAVTANVVGATASTCLDMDEAHKVDKAKFDEDFAPFTANTSAATLLWGVAANEQDLIQWYADNNEERGEKHLNLFYPCHVWMEVHEPYRLHVEERVARLGWDHPIIKTQYRLVPVAAEGRFLSPVHVRSLLSGEHERQQAPREGCRYEALIDIAAGNEEFNPDSTLEGEEETQTDSTVIWIYEVSPVLAANGLFPMIRLVNLVWLTGVQLEKQEEEIRETLDFWRISKVAIDAVGVGRQIAESMANRFGDADQGGMVVKYTASATSVSEDCFDLLARLNFSAVKMFANDGSPEWAEFERQCGWTLYASEKGKMKLQKPKGGTKHIDMVKGLTYLNRTAPVAGMHEMYSVEGDLSA
jgi:hypothetical protein